MADRVFDLDTERRNTVGINDAGLVFGLVVGGLHLIWVVLVASGFAQQVVDWILWLHFVKPVLQIEPFELDRAATLVGLTGALGYVIGIVFAALWKQFAVNRR